MNPSDALPSQRKRWYKVAVMLFLINLICFADRSNIGVAAPSMVSELGLTGTVTGVLLSAFFWGYVVTQIPGGWLSSRIGAKRVIVAALLVVGLTGCLTGLVHHFPSLLAIRFVMGLAEGVIWPSFAVFFVKWFPTSERGRAVGFSEYALPFSSVVMAPLAGWMIREFSWQTMFVMQGIPALLLALVFALIVREDPESDRSLSADERDYIVNGRTENMHRPGRFSDALKRPVIWALCLTYFCWITGMYAFGMWLPTLIKQMSNIGMEGVGWLTALPFAFGTLGMYLVSRYADRSRISRGWYVCGALVLAGVAMLAQHYVGTSVTSNMFFLVLAAVGIYSSMGAWWAWVIANVPRNQAGPCVGLINLFGNFGGICGPLIVGVLARGGQASGGFYLIGYSMIAGAVVAALVALRMQETDPQAAVAPSH